MVQLIAPVVIAAAASTDREQLRQMLTEHSGRLSLARSRHLRIWIRNRATAAAYLVLFLMVAIPCVTLFVSRDANPWINLLGVFVAAASFMFVLWLFNSNPKLIAIEERLVGEETFSRDELNKHRYSVQTIRRRMKELAR